MVAVSLSRTVDDQLAALRRRQNEHALWKSPLLAGFVQGAFSKDDLRYVFSQYHHYSKNFTRLIAAEILEPRMVRIPPGKFTETHKHAHETLIHVLEGTGQVGGRRSRAPCPAGRLGAGSSLGAAPDPEPGCHRAAVPGGHRLPVQPACVPRGRDRLPDARRRRRQAALARGRRGPALQRRRPQTRAAHEGGADARGRCGETSHEQRCDPTNQEPGSRYSSLPMWQSSSPRYRPCWVGCARPPSGRSASTAWRTARSRTWSSRRRPVSWRRCSSS